MFIIKADLKLFFNKGILFCAVLVVVLSITAGQIGDYLQKDNIVPKFSVYISDNDKTMESRMLVEGLRAFKPDVMTVVDSNDTSAAKAVKAGAYAALIIPDGFFKDIMYGNEVKASLIVNNENLFAPEIIKVFANAIKNQLSAAQAGIYAVLSEVEADSYSKYVKESNIIFFSVFMGRALEHEIVSYEKSVTIKQYFAFSFYVFIMFLLPCLIIDKAKGIKDVMPILKLKGVKNLVIYRFLSVLILFLALNIPIMAAFYLALGMKFSYLVILIVVLCQSVFCFLCLAFFDSTRQSAVAIFITQLFMAFFAGGIIPLPFLPETIKRFSVFTPNYYIARLFTSGSISYVLIIMIAACMALSFLIWAVRLKR